MKLTISLSLYQTSARSSRMSPLLSRGRIPCLSEEARKSAFPQKPFFHSDNPIFRRSCTQKASKSLTALDHARIRARWGRLDRAAGPTLCSLNHHRQRRNTGYYRRFVFRISGRGCRSRLIEVWLAYPILSPPQSWPASSPGAPPLRTAQERFQCLTSYPWAISGMEKQDLPVD